ncbi:Kelch repeat-containing protein [Raphanus sativus]|nr:Kelch repeat-containing protein [Raphanus sativus]
MKVISHIPDEEPNGGDPNKKPQEVVEKKQEDDVKRGNLLESLPDDVTELCVARVSKYNYPELSSTSTAFRRLIASPKLYITRSQLALVQRFLYVLISFPPRKLPEWYILYPSPDNASLQLRRISSLPTMPFGAAVVTTATEIYVIGGCDDGERNTRDLILIDCATHKCDRSLPRMKVARRGAAAGIVDGKIYVIGGCEKRYSDWFEVFDLRTKVWSGELVGTITAEVDLEFLSDAVMDGERIYTLDRKQRIHAFNPKTFVWTSWLDGSPLSSLWKKSSCVVDGMLYSIDPACTFYHPLVVFNPEGERCWRPVDLGASQTLMPPVLYYEQSKMANVGGKLMLLASSHCWSSTCDEEKLIWFFMIALERRQGGVIRGTVESATIVFRTMESPPSIELCRSITMYVSVTYALF